MDILAILPFIPAALIFIFGVAVMICITHPNFRNECRVGRMDIGDPDGFIWLKKGQLSYKVRKRIEDEAERIRREKEWREATKKREQEWRLFQQRMDDFRRALARELHAPNYTYFDPSMNHSEIKRRYRALARELHPDLNSNPQAAEKFRTMQAEYESLV